MDGKTIAQEHPWQVWYRTLHPVSDFANFYCFFHEIWYHAISHYQSREHFIPYLCVHVPFFLPIKGSSHEEIFWIWFYSVLFVFKSEGEMKIVSWVIQCLIPWRTTGGHSCGSSVSPYTRPSLAGSALSISLAGLIREGDTSSGVKHCLP